MNRFVNFYKHLIRAYGPYYFRQRRLYNKNRCVVGLNDKLPATKELELNGICKLADVPKDLIDMLITVRSMEDNSMILRRDTNVAPGLKERVVISLGNQRLQDYLSMEVFPYLHGYLGKSYVMRGNPRVAYNEPTKKLPADHFHLDFGLHQLTLQVLLDDLDESRTHMEYIKGSHKSSWFSLHSTIKPPGSPSDFMKDKPREKLVGKSGTAFLFDAGNGYHRACVIDSPSSYRKVLSINFTAKTHLNLQSDVYQSYDAFSDFVVSGGDFYEGHQKSCEG